jgi:hypothetical protein
MLMQHLRARCLRYVLLFVLTLPEILALNIPCITSCISYTAVAVPGILQEQHALKLFRHIKLCSHHFRIHAELRSVRS